MYPQGAGQNGPDAGADARARRREDDDAASRQGNLVAGILLSTFALIGVLMYVGSRPATVTLSPTELSVRAAGYSTTVPRADIDSVRLVSQITGLGSKLNGFQAGNAYAGLFAMKPFGKVRLYVNASRPPYVMIFSRSGVVMLNGETVDATRRLFAELDVERTARGRP